MAIIRPSIDHLDELLEPLGEAERAVFDAFAALSDDWTVYVRPKVGQDVPVLVLVNDVRGAITVDVLDWRPTDHRRPTTVDIEALGVDGQWRPSAVQPLAVARRHRNTVYEQFFAFPGDAREPGASSDRWWCCHGAPAPRRVRCSRRVWVIRPTRCWCGRRTT